jgi:5-methylcytosine-specific restriction protein B
MQYQVITASPDSVMLRNLKGKGEGLETPVSLHIVERLRNAGYKPGDLSLSGPKTDQKSEIAERIGVDRQTLFGMTGPLRAVWEHVESVSAPITNRRDVVLVIDEINRADLSRVFGELMTLLEADKRLGASEERQVMLPYSQAQFGVPAELHVVGTMNTADKSLAVMDAALRRRFLFEEVPPEPQRCAFPYAGMDLKALLSNWNRAIIVLASKANQIGHAYFEREALERIAEQYGYAQSEDGELRTIATVLRVSILPLLLDAFRGDWLSVEFVMGRDFNVAKSGLFESPSLEDLIQRGGDVLDLNGAAAPELPDWWNPKGAEWDPERFRATLAQSFG